MGNKFLSTILLVSAGALLGVTVLFKQMGDPQISQVLQKQDQILTAQGKIQEQLEIMESQWKGLATVLTQAKAQGQRPPQAAQEEDVSKVYEIPVDHYPVFGKKDAPVTLVEFVDFQCPYCARFHSAIADAVKAMPNQANYMVKNFPLQFHPLAKPASKAAFAAGEQGKYFEMVDAILEDNSGLGEEKFAALAMKIGLNVDRFKKDLKEKDAQFEEMIKKDLELGLKSDVRGTPTFFLNGKKTNARDVSSMKAAIEQAASQKK